MLSCLTFEDIFDYLGLEIIFLYLNFINFPLILSFFFWVLLIFCPFFLSYFLTELGLVNQSNEMRPNLYMKLKLRPCTYGLKCFVELHKYSRQLRSKTTLHLCRINAMKLSSHTVLQEVSDQNLLVNSHLYFLSAS